jgi:uncharacterized membrane protein YGL010W
MIAVSRQQVTEVALAIGALGALVVGWGALAVIRGTAERRQERLATLIGMLLIAAAFVIQIGAFHVGQSGSGTGGGSSPSMSSSP